ncbi:hypothetical protein Tco_0398004 [Tanacetum coccineum]
MGIRHAKAYTLRGRPSTKLEQRYKYGEKREARCVEAMRDARAKKQRRLMLESVGRIGARARTSAMCRVAGWCGHTNVTSPFIRSMDVELNLLFSLSLTLRACVRPSVARGCASLITQQQKPARASVMARIIDIVLLLLIDTRREETKARASVTGQEDADRYSVSRGGMGGYRMVCSRI